MVQAREERDPQKRAQLYKELDIFLFEKVMVFAMLADNSRLVVGSSNLADIIPDRTGNGATFLGARGLQEDVRGLWALPQNRRSLACRCASASSAACPGDRARRRLGRSPVAAVAWGLLALFVLIAVLGPLLSPADGAAADERSAPRRVSLPGTSSAPYSSARPR